MKYVYDLNEGIFPLQSILRRCFCSHRLDLDLILEVFSSFMIPWHYILKLTPRNSGTWGVFTLSSSEVHWTGGGWMCCTPSWFQAPTSTLDLYPQWSCAGTIPTDRQKNPRDLQLFSQLSASWTKPSQRGCTTLTARSAQLSEWFMWGEVAHVDLSDRPARMLNIALTAIPSMRFNKWLVQLSLGKKQWIIPQEGI